MFFIIEEGLASFPPSFSSLSSAFSSLIVLLSSSLTSLLLLPLPVLFLLVLFILIICSLFIGSKRVFRFPVLAIVICIIAAELIAYIILRWAISFIEFFFIQSRRHGSLMKAIKAAKSYSEWQAHAHILDVEQGRDSWKQEPHSRWYNAPLIHNLTDSIKSVIHRHQLKKQQNQMYNLLKHQQQHQHQHQYQDHRASPHISPPPYEHSSNYSSSHPALALAPSPSPSPSPYSFPSPSLNGQPPARYSNSYSRLSQSQSQSQFQTRARSRSRSRSRSQSRSHSLSRSQAQAHAHAHSQPQEHAQARLLARGYSRSRADRNQMHENGDAYDEHQHQQQHDDDNHEIDNDNENENEDEDGVNHESESENASRYSTRRRRSLRFVKNAVKSYEQSKRKYKKQNQRQHRSDRHDQLDNQHQHNSYLLSSPLPPSSSSSFSFSASSSLLSSPSPSPSDPISGLPSTTAMLSQYASSGAEADQELERLYSLLQTCLHKHSFGCLNEELYSKTLTGTKVLISEYVATIDYALDYIKREITQLIYEQHQRQLQEQEHASANETRRGGGGGHAYRSSSNTSINSHAYGSHHSNSVPPSSLPLSPSLPLPLPPSSAPSPSPSPSHSSLISRTLSFLSSVRLSWGHTALCLSGGAGLGNYHWGVVRALLEQKIEGGEGDGEAGDTSSERMRREGAGVGVGGGGGEREVPLGSMLPSVISGTSSGSVVASLVCTRTDEELMQLLTPDLHARLTSFDLPWTKRIKIFFRSGGTSMFDADRWLDKIKWFTNDLTFQQAYERTGRILNITCTSKRRHAPPLLMNYLTTPHVEIASAVLASVAVPGLVPPCPLYERVVSADGVEHRRPFHGMQVQWCDGSIQHDIPLSQLSELFGVSYFLVSQVNPHIIPFFFNARGEGGLPSRWRRRTGGYRGGFILSLLEAFLKEDMKKNLRMLHQLDLLPTVMGQDWSQLFVQQGDFQGHITFVPQARLVDYFRLIEDPTREQLAHYIHEGKQTCYRKLNMVMNRMKPSAAIRRCHNHILHALHKTNIKL